MSWIEEIKEYIPYNDQEAADKEAILYAISNFDNLLTRENPLAHITSSGYIVNKDKTKVLMIYHNIYDSWAWVGGHADGDDDLLRVIKKEIEEEMNQQAYDEEDLVAEEVAEEAETEEE